MQASRGPVRHPPRCVFRVGEKTHRNNVQMGMFGRNRSNVWPAPGAPAIADAVAALPLHSAVIDGGPSSSTKRASRSPLPRRPRSHGRPRAGQTVGRQIPLYCINLLFIDGYDLREWSLANPRDAILATITRIGFENAEIDELVADFDDGADPDDTIAPKILAGPPGSVRRRSAHARAPSPAGWRWPRSRRPRSAVRRRAGLGCALAGITRVAIGRRALRLHGSQAGVGARRGRYCPARGMDAGFRPRTASHPCRYSCSAARPV